MNICKIIIMTVSLALLSGAALAKAGEKKCAKYKPDRTLSSEMATDKSAVAEGTGILVRGSASVESTSAAARRQQALSNEELEKQTKVYRACLAWREGTITKKEWQSVLKRSVDLGASSRPRSGDPRKGQSESSSQPISGATGLAGPAPVPLTTAESPVQSKLNDSWRACDGGDGDACLALGDMYYSGQGVLGSERRAAELYKVGCDSNSAEACAVLGMAYERGEGVNQETNRAKELYEQACQDGSGQGCVGLGAMFLDTETEQSAQEALAWFKKGCSLDDQTSCTYLGHMYMQGAGVEPNPGYAAALFKDACLHDPGACYHLAVLYREGSGVPADIEKAIEYYDRACPAYEFACGQLGQVHWSNDDYALALPPFKEGCERDDMESCYGLAGLYNQGLGVVADPKKALSYFEKACGLGLKHAQCKEFK